MEHIKIKQLRTLLSLLEENGVKIPFSQSDISALVEQHTDSLRNVDYLKLLPIVAEKSNVFFRLLTPVGGVQ